MYTRQRIQRKTRSQFSSTSQETNGFRPQHSTNKAEATVQPQNDGTPDLQTQLETAARFGHNFGRVSVQDNTPAVIQPKLAIGAPGDKYEQEADSVAAQVMSMNAPTSQQPIQREEMASEEEEVQMKPMASMITPVVQQTGGASNLATQIQRKDPVQNISTPLDKNATIQKDGSAKLQVAKVNVTVKPDTTTKDKKMTGKAQTNCNLDWKSPSYEFKDEKVTKVGTLPPVNLTIQTVYGPNVTAKSQSGYGKGTTKEDQAAGNTDLGHHEGSHGSDAMQYLKDHPLPVFTGKEGMTVDEYKKAVEEYNQAMQDYQKNMEKDSQEKTDCVGTKADFCVEETTH